MESRIWLALKPAALDIGGRYRSGSGIKDTIQEYGVKGVQGAHGWPPEKCKERSACYFDWFGMELTTQYHLLGLHVTGQYPPPQDFCSLGQ